SAADHIGCAVFGEQKRVAPIRYLPRAMNCRGEDGITRRLVPHDEIVIGRYRHPLLGRTVADARVKEPRRTVASEYRSAGEDGGLAFVLGGSQRDGQMLPVDEVATASVPPMHVAPQRTVWIELIEEVMPAAIEHGPIGIVVPIGRRMEVVDGALGIGRGGRYGRFDRFHGLLQVGLRGA